MCLPLIVGYLSRPALIGNVLTTAPFSLTVSTCVCAFAMLTCDAPMRKCAVRCTLPMTPLPASTPLRSASNQTSVFAGQ